MDGDPFVGGNPQLQRALRVTGKNQQVFVPRCPLLIMRKDSSLFNFE